MSSLTCCLQLLMVVAGLLNIASATAAGWTYNLYSTPEMTSRTGFWNIHLDNQSNAAEVPGFRGAGFFCNDQQADFWCIDSEVLKFAVPRTSLEKQGKRWHYRGLNYELRGERELVVLGHSFKVWIIKSERDGAAYATYLYSETAGLLAFELSQDTSFHASEFYLSTTAKGYPQDQ